MFCGVDEGAVCGVPGVRVTNSRSVPGKRKLVPSFCIKTQHLAKKTTRIYYKKKVCVY